jgi:cytidine deaminase
MSASPEAGQAAEDAKLVTLARSARVRTQAVEGAAVRDDMGRTYAAATVTLPSLRLSALQAAVAAAVSSGSERLEAAVVVSSSDDLSADDRAVLADLGVATVLSAAPDGTVR